MNEPGNNEARSRRELEPEATIARALDFVAHWCELGGEAISLGDFSPKKNCTPLKLSKIPVWAETIGAVISPESGRALIWVAPLPSADGPLQLAFKRPESWKDTPVFIHYTGIAGDRGASGDGLPLSGSKRRFSGFERASGELLVLNLPAHGETLILVAEIELNESTSKGRGAVS